MEIDAFSTTSWNETHSPTEINYQILEMLLMDNIYVSIVTKEWHTPTKLVTYPYIPILYGITPREYPTSCTYAWSRRIIWWPTTAKIEIILSSTSYSGQNSRWPRLVCYIMIWETSPRINMCTSWWTTHVPPYHKLSTRIKDTPPATKNYLIV